eukprot:1430986-Rhodomonas_salina.1
MQLIWQHKTVDLAPGARCSPALPRHTPPSATPPCPRDLAQYRHYVEESDVAPGIAPPPPFLPLLLKPLERVAAH